MYATVFDSKEEECIEEKQDILIQSVKGNGRKIISCGGHGTSSGLLAR